MHNASLLGVTLALLSATSAFVLPSNQADGIYRVRNIAGRDVHEIVKPATSRRDTSAAAHQLDKRDDPVGTIHCGCGFGLNNGDTDAAVADLKGQLNDRVNQYIQPAMAYYSIRGGTVAFVCNDDGNAPRRAWPDQLTTAFSQITDACGLYVAGSTGAAFDFSIGYMQNSDGLDFCGAALGAPADSC